MIPKIIHYCWFGRNPLPKLAIKCIKSWKKYCPDYEIIEWNEDNFDISVAPLYVRQAYETKKWAFVTDYVRLWAMVNFGGVYMDTDVEVVKPLDDFLQHKAFSGFEDDIHIPTGIMASEQDFPLFKSFLAFYDDAEFIKSDGSLNMVTNVAIMTDMCLKRGLIQNGQFQLVEDFALYPKEFFCPVSYGTNVLERTDNTAAIHWFAGSWQPTDVKKKRKRDEAKYRRHEFMYTVRYTPNRVLMTILGETGYNKLKVFLKGNSQEK